NHDGKCGFVSYTLKVPSHGRVTIKLEITPLTPTTPVGHLDPPIMTHIYNHGSHSDPVATDSAMAEFVHEFMDDLNPSSATTVGPPRFLSSALFGSCHRLAYWGAFAGAVAVGLWLAPAVLPAGLLLAEDIALLHAIESVYAVTALGDDLLALSP